MLHRALLLPALLLASLGSCAGPGPISLSGPPLEPLSTFPVSYRSTLSLEGLGSSPSRPVEEANEALPRIEVRAWRIELPTDQARALARGADRWFHGSRVASEELEQRLSEVRELPGVTVDVLPRILVREGGRASVRSTTQRAFLERYEIKNDGEVMPGLIADPVVAVAQEGTRFELEVEPGAVSDPLALRFLWESVTTQGDPVRSSGYLPGLPRTLEIQLLVFTKQVLEAEVTVGPGEGLLVGPAPVNDGQRAEALVLFARRLGPRTAAR